MNNAGEREKLNELIQIREQEWRHLQKHQHNVTETELAEKTKLINLQNVRFKKLKEDFEYNLKLLKDRDIELEKYELLFTQFKEQENLRTAKLSDLKIRIDIAETKAAQSEKENKELQRDHHLRIIHLQEEANRFYTLKENEVHKEKTNYENLKKTLQRKTSEIEENFEVKKLQYEEEWRGRVKQMEDEFRLKVDEKDAGVREAQIKVRVVSKELEILKNSVSETTSQSTLEHEKLKQIEKRLKEKCWEAEDLKKMGEVKVKNLEMKIQNLLFTTKAEKEQFTKKHSDLKRRYNEVRSQLETLRNTCEDNNEMAVEKMKQLTHSNTEHNNKLKQMEWKHADVVKQHQNALRGAGQENSHLLLKLKQLEESHGHTLVAKDVQISTLQSSEAQLKQQLQLTTTQLNKYTKELEYALERENILEKGRVDLEVEWKRHAELKQNEMIQNSQQFVANAKAENEQLNLLLKEKENKLLNNESVIAELKKTIEGHQSNDVQEQNVQLKAVIREMRAEMESLTQQIDNSVTDRGSSQDKGYVDSMERKVSELKSTNRDLENKIEDLKIRKPPSGRDEAKIQELNKNLGILLSEKIELQGSLKTKDELISRLRSTVNTAEKEGLCENHPLKTKTTNITHKLKEVIASSHVEKTESLKEKLRIAIDRIRELTVERTKLIDNYNRLRSEAQKLKDELDEVKKKNFADEINESSSLHEVEEITNQKDVESIRVSTSASHSSIKELWNMLENEVTISSIESQAVRGKKISPKQPTNNKKKKVKPKIRNYNVKSD